MATAVFLATLAHFLNEPISQANHLVSILKFEVYNNHNVIACGEQMCSSVLNENSSEISQRHYSRTSLQQTPLGPKLTIVRCLYFIYV